MTSVAASVVDAGKLGGVVLVTLAAGVGITAVFALAVYGGARAGDMRRQDRGGAATAYLALAATCVLACSLIVVYGLLLAVKK